jgi:hypothetical protein
MRVDCDSEKQCHGYHGGSDVECNSHFHSTSANHKGTVMPLEVNSQSYNLFVRVDSRFLDMLGCCVI